MKRWLSILFATSFLLGCAKADERNPSDWKSLALPGKTLTLIDRKKMEIFPFSEGGTTAATIGTKDGALAGPIFYWKIQGNVLVISEEPDSGVYEELSSPMINGSVVTATRKSGSKSQYQLAKSR
ncbi:MAG TPA: hypothetical protein VGM81_01700 [Burkholderiaceae bacterium]|jgi:hypothetical protein